MHRQNAPVVALLLLVAAVGVAGGVVYTLTAGSAQSAHGDSLDTTLAFEDVSQRAGFTYEATSGAGVQGMISDAGVYAADVDGDGWTDLLAVGGDRPVLFENDRGQFRPSDALPRLDRSVRAALFVDYDADGWEDLLLLSDDREPLLLANDGGSFERVDAGFDRRLGVPIGAAAADYNRDGCPDLFVVQNGRWAAHPPLGLRNVSVPLDADNGLSNVLYTGTCSGFHRADSAAIRGTRWSLATSFVDLTGDGWADIHVANDFNRDVVYVNRRDGSFDRVVLSNRTDRNGMSSEIADVTGDGRPDIFVTNIYHPYVVKEHLPEGQAARADGNTLLVNRGNGTFVDRADAFNVSRGGWGWAAVVDDFDNDMDRDLFHTTQRIRLRTNPSVRLDATELGMIEALYPSYRYPLFAERRGDGFARRNASALGFAETDGRGAARLDFDRDGRLDLVVANAGGEFRLYRNVGRTGSSLRVVLDGAGATRPLGATVSVTAGEETQMRRYHSNTDFLSQGSRTLHFGTGTHDRVDVTVRWPDGTTQTFRDVETGQRVVVTPDGGLTAAEADD